MCLEVDRRLTEELREKYKDLDTDELKTEWDVEVYKVVEVITPQYFFYSQEGTRDFCTPYMGTHVYIGKELVAYPRDFTPHEMRVESGAIHCYADYEGALAAINQIGSLGYGKYVIIRCEANTDDFIAAGFGSGGQVELAFDRILPVEVCEEHCEIK